MANNTCLSAVMDITASDYMGAHSFFIPALVNSLAYSIPLSLAALFDIGSCPLVVAALLEVFAKGNTAALGFIDIAVLYDPSLGPVRSYHTVLRCRGRSPLCCSFTYCKTVKCDISDAFFQRIKTILSYRDLYDRISGIYILKRYLKTVGNGGTMNLGIAPNKDGLLDDEDVKALADFGKLKAAVFSKPITNGLCNVVVMSEDVVNRGETCDEWQLFDGREKLVYGRTIGIKRIRTLDRPRRAENIRLEVYGDNAEALPMKFYYVEPEFLKAVLSATTDSGETDTAKWMTAGKQGAGD